MSDFDAVFDELSAHPEMSRDLIRVAALGDESP
jgi:hypothetical protein